MSNVTYRKTRISEHIRSLKLGDAVASVAQPIAKVIDSTLGTNIQECGGCKKRREALNKAFSDKT